MQSRRNSFSRYSSKYPNLNISYEIRQELTIALQEATIKPNETNLKRIIEALRQAFAHVLSNELPKLDFLTNDKYIDEWTQFLLQNTDGKILSKYLKTEGVSIKRDIFHIRIFRNRKVLREKLVYYFRSEQSKGLEIEKIWYTFFMNPSSYNSRLKPATHG